MKNLAYALAILAAIFAVIAAFHRRKAKAAGTKPRRHNDRLPDRTVAPRHRFKSANAFDLRPLVQAGYDKAAAATWTALAFIFFAASIAAAWAG